VKRLIPAFARSLLRNWRTQRRQRQYAPLTLEETFERVYHAKAWCGGDALTPNSGTGSTGRYVVEYCALITAVLRQNNVRSLADLGCGVNTRVHAGEGVRFVRADVTRDALPPADAAILRQVLQHLTNAEVALALSNVLRTYSMALVTEHIYVGPGARPNRDMAHGPGTRVPLRSGVLIDQAPFGVRATVLGDIDYAPNQVLRTWAVRGGETAC
jgi:hypothetical protein